MGFHARICLLIFTPFAFNPISANHWTGEVLDLVTKKPTEWVKVHIEEKNHTTETDEKWHFNLGPMTGQRLTDTIYNETTTPGFQTLDLRVSRLVAGFTLALDVKTPWMRTIPNIYPACCAVTKPEFRNPVAASC